MNKNEKEMQEHAVVISLRCMYTGAWLYVNMQ